jgi:membrane-bound lytic murein transglycosylase D
VPNRNEEEKLVLYKVENGDTLWAIAKRFEGMTIEKLRALNNLKSNESLKAGMILKVIKKA